MSWTAEDKEIAEHAAQTLEKLQGKKGHDVVSELEIVGSRVKNKLYDEHERAAAWLAVCELVKALDETRDAENVAGLWDRAIQAVKAWHGSMK